MRMKKTILMLMLITVSACHSQVPGGTVNGIPIPNKAFAPARTNVEVDWRLKHKSASITAADAPEIERLIQADRCKRLNGNIAGMLQDELINDMAITVTPADIAEVRKMFPFPDPQQEVARMHEHSAAILAALDAVNRKEDPQAVYEQYLKPHGITPQEWSVEMIYGPTGEGKRSLAREQNMTVAMVQQAIKNSDGVYQAKYKKMKERIDDQISLSDPTFKEYLGEYNRSVVIDGPGRTHSSGVSRDHLDYVAQRRNAWWAAYHKKAQVIINDPTMQTCDLSAYGR
jgi:hypothetical protein